MIKDFDYCTITFKDVSYDSLNNFQFDVSNLSIDTYADIAYNKQKVSFEIIYKGCKKQQFINWYNDVYDASKSFNPYKSNDTILKIYRNSKLIRQLKLIEAYPVNISTEESDIIIVSFDAVVYSLHDIIEDNEVKLCNNLNNTYDTIRPIVIMLKDIEAIEEDLNIVGLPYNECAKQFIISLDDYKDFLEKKCIEFVKEHYK